MESSENSSMDASAHLFRPDMSIEFHDHMSIEHDNEACETEPSRDDNVFRIAQSFPREVAARLLLILEPYYPEIKGEIAQGYMNSLSSDHKQMLLANVKGPRNYLIERLPRVNKYIMGNVLTQFAKRDPKLVTWMDEIFVITLGKMLIWSNSCSADGGTDTDGNGINDLTIVIRPPPHLEKARVKMGSGKTMSLS